MPRHRRTAVSVCSLFRFPSVLPFKSVSNAVDRFLEELERSLSDHLFVKLTLSNYRGPQDHLQKIIVRPIGTKKGPRLLFQFRHDTRDIAKNYQISEARDQVRTLLDS